ncbi:MAG: Rpn family recombination-promoting nuclease/putative transposase [Lachnoclostridium sp.]|nr:Rpn family recombination-promoting nuclease/putative transposase [Lachnospira sp.]MCM1246939.1 Rpn family recombination-promoting nuclease/putative transposase [Lachnoclostridium sp.]
MGKYDDAMYRYLSDNDRFADLFNAVFFDGRQVLKGEMLEPEGERYTERVPNGGDFSDEEKDPGGKEDSGGEKGFGGEKRTADADRGNPLKLPEYETGFRDLKKRLRTGESFVVAAVENQSDIDYAMPWRIMRYDQQEYGRQIDGLRKGKRKKRQEAGLPVSSWAERMAREDRLHPVYTICFYHGTKEWDGPRSLKDMMSFPEGEEWRRHFCDYGMLLFCAGEPGDLGRFGTELGQLLAVLSCRQDKKKLYELWQKEEFAGLDRETMETMAVLTDSTEILNRLEEYRNEEEGGYSMCLAVDEMRKEWKEEGIAEGIEKGKAEGIIETGFDFGLSESDILEKLQQKMQISVEKAQEYLNLYRVQTV